MGLHCSLHQRSPDFWNGRRLRMKVSPSELVLASRDLCAQGSQPRPQSHTSCFSNISTICCLDSILRFRCSSDESDISGYCSAICSGVRSSRSESLMPKQCILLPATFPTSSVSPYGPNITSGGGHGVEGVLVTLSLAVHDPARLTTELHRLHRYYAHATTSPSAGRIHVTRGSLGTVRGHSNLLCLCFFRSAGFAPAGMHSTCHGLPGLHCT